MPQAGIAVFLLLASRGGRSDKSKTDFLKDTVTAVSVTLPNADTTAGVI